MRKPIPLTRAVQKKITMITNLGPNRPVPDRYGMCVDVNECAADPEACDGESETCVNLPGRHRCMCRWGFAWSPDRRRCVPDAAVKRAEIRSVIGRRDPTSVPRQRRHHNNVTLCLAPICAPDRSACARHDFTVTRDHGHNRGCEFNALACFFFLLLRVAKSVSCYL